MRAFFAIDLPEDQRAALEELQAGLRVGRIMAPGTLHLTLAFLDDQPQAVLADLHATLDGLSLPAFDLRLQGLGTFGSRSPAILWAGVAPNPALDATRKAVRRAARAAGIDLPRERFRPHVTLARFKRLHPDQMQALDRFIAAQGGFAAPQFHVDRLTLFQSTRHSDGARHDVLAEYPLTQ